MKSNLKYRKENLELRRDQVQTLNARGLSQRDIAARLNVSIGLINSDLKIIRKRAQESVSKYDEKLPEEYHQCLVGLNDIKKQMWHMYDTVSDPKAKISALALAKECHNDRLSLLTNSSTIQNIRKFVNKEKQKDTHFYSNEEKPLSSNEHNEEEQEETEEEDASKTY